MSLRFELSMAAEAASRHGPRTGTLHLERSPTDTISIATPGFLKYTRRGLQPHMVREVEREVTALSAASRVQLEDFLERDFPAVGKYSEGLHRFVHMDRSELLLLDALDPTVTRRTAKATNKFLGVDSEGGTKRVTPEMFVKLVNQLKPDVYVALADYVEEPEPSATKGKRIAKSVERIGPVAGRLREGDHGLGPPFGEKLALVRHSLATLEPAKPRYMVGVSSPDQVLQAIRLGIDVFDSSYPYAVTEQGFASTAARTSTCGSSRCLTISARWWTGCTCFACRSHHRAYVHHLLMTKEMLATVLLQIHNMHCYNRFFEAVRQSLASGDFEQCAEKFLDHYGCMAGEAAGAKGVKRAFDELELLASQANSPTTKDPAQAAQRGDCQCRRLIFELVLARAALCGGHYFMELWYF
ncbi:tRNA-guanine transglycosylase [Linderina pennispora]|uniref:tRNA-guanine transglycosylase n=1 Tax=Linderina pennispora TaxID=61395 RepID=A0A1Y1WD73_9FUNG|nr:tRNA-guanine transglycosylase [Linderina pennispora]ORX71402.1 tRNA-guanine transglycosylase [Linderina pennispora]